MRPNRRDAGGALARPDDDIVDDARKTTAISGPLQPARPTLSRGRAREGGARPQLECGEAVAMTLA